MDALAELGAHSALVANHIGPGATEARGAHRLVGVDHDVVLGGLNDGVMVVVVDGLGVVALGEGDDGADIAALHGVVAVLVHQVVCLLHPALVVDSRGAALVVHDKADAFLMGVFVQRRQVEVRIGGEEVEDKVFLLAVPVLPADVPALDEEGVEAVLGGEVDVAAHVGVVGTVGAVGEGMLEIGLAELHGGEFIGVVPGALAADHLPPHAHVFHGVNPTDILQRAGLVEVEYQPRPQHVGGLVADHHGAPRGVTGGLHTPFIACGIRAEPRAESKRHGVKIEVHGGIVERGGLVDVDIESVVGLHLQGCLHAGARESRPRPATVLVAFLPETVDLREAALGVVVLLRVVVAWYPPRHVVARHHKLGQFLLEPEADESVGSGKLVAEAEAVVVEAEANLHDGGQGLGASVGALYGTCRLLERHQHLVVMVADVGLLAPHGLPSLVERAEFHILEDEGMGEVVAPFQREAHLRRKHHGLAVAVETVIRHAIFQLEAQFQPSVGTCQRLQGDWRIGSGGDGCRQQHKYYCKNLSHILSKI